MRIHSVHRWSLVLTLRTGRIPPLIPSCLSQSVFSSLLTQPQLAHKSKLQMVIFTNHFSFNSHIKIYLLFLGCMRINISSTNIHQPRFSSTFLLVVGFMGKIVSIFSKYKNMMIFQTTSPPIPFHSDIPLFGITALTVLLKILTSHVSCPALFIPGYLLWILRYLTPWSDFGACCSSSQLEPCWFSARLIVPTGEDFQGQPFREESHTHWISLLYLENTW